jgi:hypothetical protein
MPFALVNNGTGFVTFPAGLPTISIPSSTPFKIRFKCNFASIATEQPIIANTSATGSNFIVMSGTSKAFIFRANGDTTLLQSAAIVANTDYEVLIQRTGVSSLSMHINGVQVATATSTLAVTFNEMMRRGSAIISNGGLVYYFEVEVDGVAQDLLRNDIDNTQTTWPNLVTAGRYGVLNNFAAGAAKWLEYSDGPSFEWATIPEQSATVGTPFTLNLASFITGATSYASIGSALPVWASLNTSTGAITGTPTVAALTSGLQFSASDGTDTANSNTFSIDVEAGATVPQGTITITGVTRTTATANVSYSYNLLDATSYEYRLSGGAAITALSNPITITALTPGTAYNVEVRAVNAQGTGAWSTATDFTTLSAVSLQTGVIKNETLTTLADTLFPTVDVNSASGALVVRFTNVTSSPAGVITLTDAAFLSGTTYRLWYELPSGDFGAEKVVAS